MTRNEAKNLQINDEVVHKYLKTTWIIVETKLYKSNPARFDHVVQLKDSVRKNKFNNRNYQLWEVRDGKTKTTISGDGSS